MEEENRDLKLKCQRTEDVRNEVQGLIDNGLLAQNQDGNIRVVDNPAEREQIQSESKRKQNMMQQEPMQNRRQSQ